MSSGIENVTFLGAADSLDWKDFNNHVSQALNGGLPIARAKALAQRYDRGTVGVTHENERGVKVLFSQKQPQTLEAFTGNGGDGENDAPLFYIYQPPAKENERTDHLRLWLGHVFPIPPELFGREIKWKNPTWEFGIAGTFQIGNSAVFIGPRAKFRKDKTDFLRGVNESRFTLGLDVLFQIAEPTFVCFTIAGVLHRFVHDGFEWSGVRPVVELEIIYAIPIGKYKFGIAGMVESMYVELGYLPDGSLLRYMDVNFGIKGIFIIPVSH